MSATCLLELDETLLANHFGTIGLLKVVDFILMNIHLFLYMIPYWAFFCYVRVIAFVESLISIYFNLAERQNNRSSKDLDI